MARLKNQENPFKYVFKREFLIQSITSSVGTSLVSLAYLYAPTALLTSARRGTSVLASVISGNRVFHEKKLLIKIISFVFVITGLTLLVL